MFFSLSSFLIILQTANIECFFCFLSNHQPPTPPMYSLMPKKEQHWRKGHWHRHFTEIKYTCTLLRFSQQLMLDILVLSNVTRLHHWSSSWYQNSQLQQNIDGSTSEIITNYKKNRYCCCCYYYYSAVLKYLYAKKQEPVYM